MGINNKTEVIEIRYQHFDGKFYAILSDDRKIGFRNHYSLPDDVNDMVVYYLFKNDSRRLLWV